MRFELRIPSPVGALFCSLSSDDECLAVEEGFVVDQQPCGYVDFYRGAAPPTRQIRCDLGKFAACRGFGSLPTHLDKSAITSREDHWLRACVLAQHLAFETVLAPREVERQIEGLGQRFQIAVSARPVHQRAAFCAIYFVVVQGDLGKINPKIDEMQEAGQRVFSAAGENQNSTVLIEVWSELIAQRWGIGLARLGAE